MLGVCAAANAYDYVIIVKQQSYVAVGYVTNDAADRRRAAVARYTLHAASGR